MDYLLDTNVCIALIKNTDALVRSRFQKVSHAGGRVYVPSVVTFELWYGVANSTRIAFNTERLETFLSGLVTVLPFDNDDALAAGSIRATLEAAGKPIGAYDYLIAGQALARQLTLVTANISEFSRVKGLMWQDWAKP
ncbi:MAG: type II toxin-antitoxin system VapC family toxin [Candidatus Sulfotelmatobacter sp.]